VLQEKLAGRVDDLLEQPREAVLLEPLGEEVLAPEGELVDVGLEEDVVDGDHRLAVGTHPLIGHYMDEKPSALRGKWVVLDDFYTHWRLAVDCQQRDCDGYEVSIFLE
jgi:hypothetical protein